MEINKIISVEDLYNSLLKHEDISTCLASFVTQAENFNSKVSEYDIVKKYLHISGNCNEILQLVKEIPNSDSQIVVLVMQTLCHILIRIASDLHIFVSVGTSFVTEILSSGMKSIFTFLKMKQKSSRTKIALHLLTSMVAVGGQTAHHVVSKLDFSNITFTHLLTRRNFSFVTNALTLSKRALTMNCPEWTSPMTDTYTSNRKVPVRLLKISLMNVPPLIAGREGTEIKILQDLEEEDIRTTFVNLIVVIMTTCDFSVIRRLVEIKGFLNDILPGLVSDRTQVIILVLSTFRRLIVENTLLPKTTKLRLFNDHSLKSVIKLYSWNGPIRTATKFKRKLGDQEQSVAYEVSEEECESVKKCAHEFLMSLCCSFKTGIIFQDPSCGTSGKNHNQVLTKILKYFGKPHLDKLSSNFVVSVLKACPDQINFYLPYLKDSCKPRPSPFWVNAMDLIKRVILIQDPISCLFDCEEKKSVSDLIHISKTLCFPNIITPSEISDTLKDGKSFVCYHICDFLACVLKQVKKIMKHCTNMTFSKTSYSSAEISIFKQSFSSTIIQIFSFMKDIEDFWVKLTSEKLESTEVTGEALSLPSLTDQLLKILEVIQLFLDVSHDGYHSFDFNLPKLYQSFKSCHSLLPQEDISRVNIKIVNMIAVQGEEAISLSNKNMIDSPLTVLLDVYLTSPSKNMVDDISQILNKVLLHTKVFEFCTWEMNVWLECMKSSKAKHIHFIIEFINQTICTLLQNPNLFADEITENTLTKYNSSSDVTTVLNALLSSEMDPVLVEEFENAKSFPITQRQYFSSLVPAAFYTLNSVDDHKRKGCQAFLERVLYHIIHHQQTPEVLFSVIQKYKSSLSSSLYNYCELLCPGRFGQKIENDVSIVCKPDLCNHLKAKFLTLHSLQDSSKGCHCSIQYEPGQLDDTSKEKIIWQLLTYLEWEITLILEDKLENCDVLCYLNLLENILHSFNETQALSQDDDIQMSEEDISQCVNVKFQVIEEILSRPVLLKLFLWTEKVPKSKKTLMKKIISTATELILNLSAEIIPHNVCQEVLIGYKDKVVKFNSFLFQSVNLQKNAIICDNSDINKFIGSFSVLFSASDIAYMLEDLLNFGFKSEDPKLYFSTLLLVFKMYIDSKDFVLIYPKTIHSLFDKYVNMSNKEKKNLRIFIMQMFEKHPILASAVEADSCCYLLKQTSSKNFYILGSLIDSSIQQRQTIQLAIIANLETLEGSPDFIFLASKCILNSTSDESADLDFLKSVSLSFWNTLTNYILMNLTSPDTLLEVCGAGKALQILFHKSLLSLKKLNKFLKMNEEILRNSVPGSSKMLIFLQLMEITRSHHLESNRSTMAILKNWLTSVVSTCQNSSDFNYSLLEFSFCYFEGILEIDIEVMDQVENFCITILKFALKNLKPGKKLIDLLNVLCKKWKDIPAQSIFNLVTGHSNFFNIMLSDIKEEETFKESVTDLLITLVSADNKVCKDNHLGLFLSSYSGTLKSVDRKLLYLIKLYSESDVDVTLFRPFLWSKTAVAYYSVMNSGTEHLWKKPSTRDVLNMFLLHKIEATAEKYPLTLKLDPTLSETCEELENCSDVDKIYDLRFLLPLFASLLSPGSFVHCKSFLESKVLILIFTSLSSFDPSTRALGYYCLSQLYYHLEGANYADKQIWICLLDSVRNSIVTENPRLPSIITLFLSKITHIFTKPDHALFCILYQFILVKPALDIGNVPEFYKLFNSTEIEHREQRLWLLRLMADGLRSSADFHIYEKRYLFRLLLTHYSSSISSADEKIEVLNTVSAAVKVDSSARILCQNALLVWLHNIIEETNLAGVSILRILCSLLKNLWFTVKKFCYKKQQDHNENTEEPDTDLSKNSLYSSFPVEFQLVLLHFLKKLKALDSSSVNNYLLTLKDVMILLNNSEMSVLSPCNLSLAHITEMLECWQSMIDKIQDIKDSKPTFKPLNNISDFKQCCDLFAEIFLFWTPNWNCSSMYYDQQLYTVLNAVQMILQYRCLSTFYTSDLPTWLYRCFKKDKNFELVKLFLSAEGETCLKLILDIFEQSLSIQSEFSKTMGDLQLCTESRINTSNQWRKILSYFKKICNMYNLSPELNLYHQITIIL